MLVSSYIPEFVLKVASILGSSAYNAVYSYLSYGRGQQFGSNYDVGFMLFKALINIIFLLLLFTYIVYRKKKIGTLYNEEHFLNLYIIGSYIYIIALFSSTALTRAALTYNSVQYYMLPKIFDLPEFSRNKKTKLIIFILLVIYLFIRMRMNIYSSDYIPFKLQ